MADRLTEYRRKRDPRRTPEPVPEAPPKPGEGAARFVIQQHHARRLHWDLRLERDGVLASWAVPRGLPRDQGRNHLAVHTEDHPMEYLTFAGEIPKGEYGGGHMHVYDTGTYTAEKWRDDEVIFTLHGERAQGRYVLFQTGGKDWMIRRMDPPPPGWQSMPTELAPMHAAPAAKLPPDDDAWAYELLWDGARTICAVAGGRPQVLGGEAPENLPELRAMAEALAPLECVLDGVLVAFGTDGAISPTALAPRLRGGDTAAARRAAERHPAQYLITDLLWLEGTPTVELPYVQRRELLEQLALAGPSWQVPPYFPGDGHAAVDAARAQAAPAVIAKRLDSPYLPGQRSKRWLRVRV